MALIEIPLGECGLCHGHFEEGRAPPVGCPGVDPRVRGQELGAQINLVLQGGGGELVVTEA